MMRVWLENLDVGSEKMKEFTANYSYSNHNFVVQNINSNPINNKYTPAICILKNILQRGTPTLLSVFLQEHLGAIHKRDDFYKPYPLISKVIPTWARVIKGDIKRNYFPARIFYEELIKKYLPEYAFIQQLIIPEVEINEITQVDVDEFKNKTVDFYLPQAYLVIEIDGMQHNEAEDIYRDKYLRKYKIETVRIKTSDIEAESDAFKESILKIKNRIERAINKQIHKDDDNNILLGMKDYHKAFVEDIDLTHPQYIATAIIRFQILILSLLEYGILDFDNEWEIEILERDIKDFAQIAIDDLFIWFKHILQLQKITFAKPKISIIKIADISEFTTESNVKIDFSLLQRFTDEFEGYPHVYFVRTHYFENYRLFQYCTSSAPKFSRIAKRDFFYVSRTKPIKYRLELGQNSKDEKALLYLLWNVFLQTQEDLSFNGLKFREGQLPIIANALEGNDTIGLLPTGSGKSVCYQLSCILQPSISFVVCPIKSLMFDQTTDLQNSFFSRVEHITGDDDAELRQYKQQSFGDGRYFFIFISPERFQTSSFRQYLSAVDKKYNIAYAVIDEVHCLSEWGHDFRLSYLCLANTIRKYCKNSRFIGLTATASINVLKDIQIEFDISDENVKTQLYFTREELEFIIINDETYKQDAIIKTLTHLQRHGALLEQGENTKAGIIFTQAVNGIAGCYKLSRDLSEYFKKEILFYSGKPPKEIKSQKTLSKPFDEYKNQLQNRFKNNQSSLIVATKAFGMGINKGNIHYTIHYGIPSSMEALYQEAGRAGRSNSFSKENSAKCYVLFSKAKNQNALSKLWDRNTELSTLKNLQKQVGGDINTNLFLLTSNLSDINQDFKVTQRLFKLFAKPKLKQNTVNANQIGCNKKQAEKAIYRLFQLGIVEDWTVTDFFKGVFVVDFCQFDDESIKQSLVRIIQKYDSSFSIEAINMQSQYFRSQNDFTFQLNNTVLDTCLLILLQWSYDNFVYNRRQSLKNIYENCNAYIEGHLTSEEFKIRLENYFKFTKSSFILQHIAESPDDHEQWFEPFYLNETDTETKNKRIIIEDKLLALKDNLSRFLESYMSNVGLDLISGLLRLSLNDYDNADGRKRFESALAQISQKYDVDKRDNILQKILAIGASFDKTNKDLLAQSIYKFFDDKQTLMAMSVALGDIYSMSHILNDTLNRLQRVNKEIYGRFEKIG